MKKLLTLFFVALMGASAMAQSVTLTFTGRDREGQTIKMDHIFIKNVNRGWTEMIDWPDTVLTLNVVGVGEFVAGSGFSLSQNTPNPFEGSTRVCLNVSEPGNVVLEVMDVTGRMVAMSQAASLQPGAHRIDVSLRNAGMYFLTARQNGKTTSVKMVSRGNGGKDAVEFTGEVTESPVQQQGNTTKSVALFHPIFWGDTMQYIGYNTTKKYTSVTLFHTIDSSQTIVLQFVDCKEEPEVRDVDGNIYSTVKIGDQCWMRENLRVRHFPDGKLIPYMSGYSTDSPNSPYLIYEICYGVFTHTAYYYNWTAATDSCGSTNPNQVRGICPSGWHVPSRTEWEQLRNYLEHQPEYMCGNGIAKALASTVDWDVSTESSCAVGYNPRTNNATGFSVYPDGYNPRYSSWAYSKSAYFWSAEQNFVDSDEAFYFSMNYNWSSPYMQYETKSRLYSVRCLRNY